MKTFPKIAAAVAVAGAAVVAAVLPGGAVASESPSAPAIRVESPATLEARGAAVRLSLTLVCPAGQQISPYVSLTQRSGSGVASGGTSPSPVTCTGSAQAVEAVISASTSGEAFRKGPAFAKASFYTYVAGYVTDEREIEIVR
ncbi:MAG: hypothetical protein HOY78_04945 [Saccharothrix sp.]|nr:hypothetical protein [Saccharothrix sp.]